MKVDEDGTLHMEGMTIPPSDLCSAEFAAFSARYSVQRAKEMNVQSASNTSARSGVALPARTAPTAEWDKFDAWVTSLAGSTSICCHE